MKNLLIILLLFSTCFTFGQEISVTGTVTDKTTGEPLPGVNILISGTSIGTVTDLDGNYQISAPQDGTLKFSYVGYLPEDIMVNNKTVIDVLLSPDLKQLDEVIVIGYGQIKKSDLTGSVSTVSVDNASESGVTSVNKMLQGRAAGVNVKTNSGVPGGAVQITIRGSGSMSASTQPLYVIDGIIIDASSEDITGSDLTESDPMSFLSPEDIESIEILKDASATAIYGSRGANGVVLIQTKGGKVGNMNLDYSFNYGFTQIAKTLDLMDGPTYARYENDMAALAGEELPFDGRNESHPLPDSVNWIDWHDEMYGTGTSMQHRLSLSGGDEKSTYFAAFGMLTSDGIIESTGFDKFDFRTNFTKKLSDRVTVRTNFSGAYLTNNLTVGTDQFGGNKSMVGSILRTSPILNDYLDDDSQSEMDMLGENNPYAWRDQHSDESIQKTFNTKFDVDIKIFEWLTYESRLGVNYRIKNRRLYYGKNLNRGAPSGYARMYNWENGHYVFDNLLQFNKSLMNHTFLGTLGVTYDSKINNQSQFESIDFIDDFLGANYMDAATTTTIVSDFKSEVTYASALFRLNYGYKNKLNVTVTGRADGSSKFAEGNQWGYFPSLAGAYKLHKENFLKNSDILSMFKVRAGWGQVGNSSSPAYATKDQFFHELDVSIKGIVGLWDASNLNNSGLTWETSEQTNLGLDLGFFKNRLMFILDVYNKTTKNQLQNLAVGLNSGFDRQWVNAGTVNNKGLEFTTDIVVLDKTFKMQVGGNFALNMNKVVDVGEMYLPDELGRIKYMGNDIGGNNEVKLPVNAFIEGHPVGVFWGFKTDGILQDTAVMFGNVIAPGNIKIVDVSGPEGSPDGVIDSYDYTIIGDPNPDFTYGFYGSMSYKGIALDFQFSGAQGMDVFNATAIRLEDHNNSGNKLTRAYTEAWSPENPTGTYPTLQLDESVYGPKYTDRWIEDASFLKLNYVTLSYTAKFKDSAIINKCKFYVTGNTLLTFTKYSGYDPEVNSFTSDPLRRGIDFNSFPAVRSVLFGLNVTF
jgi:TonB-linked SusC/RagA family outer membrane protein